MLMKLMKHEFRATLRVMLPLYLLLIATSFGAKAAVSGLLETEFALVDILASLLVVAFAVTMAAVCLMSVFLMVHRFYSNLLRDEGYVMLTLPVSVHQHVWSKLLVGVVWCGATVLVVCAALFILVFNLELVEGMVRGFGDVMKYFWAEFGVDGALGIVEVLVVCFCAACSMFLKFYAALAIGHSFSDHKLVWSIGAYLGMDFVTSLGTGLLMTLLDLAGVPDVLPSLLDAVWAGHVTLWLAAIWSALAAAMYYAITVWFMKHKVNLD